jgi:hypothetical protein
MSGMIVALQSRILPNTEEFGGSASQKRGQSEQRKDEIYNE